MDLVYDLEGNFLYRNLQMPSEDLPITIVSVVKQSYPDYLMRDTVNLQDWGERIQYEIMLEGLSKGLEIIIDEEGTVTCECEED